MCLSSCRAEGDSLMNLFAIGGVGILQALSGLVFERTGDFGAVFSVYFIFDPYWFGRILLVKR